MDSLGRTQQQLWRDYGTSADLDKFAYGYDRNSNRLWRENAVAAAASVDLDEAYAYDNLDRLTTFHRGNLDGNHAIPATTNRTYGQAWGLSAVGAWNGFQVDSNGDGDYSDTGTEEVDQNRTHNLANEIFNETAGAAITEGGGQSAWADPAYDARGNMTTVPKPSDLTSTYACKYDAWNRLAEVRSGEIVVAKYEYDALNRRTKECVDTDLDGDFDEFRHFYYTAGWQLLETRLSESENTEPETLYPEYQYVWSLRYLDAPVLRDENKDADDDCTESGTDERLYYANDANMNVTALVGDDGTVLERYVYDPYGKVTIYDDDWSETRNTSSYDNSILFCGYYRDNETGLYHVRNRYYHPYFGWITRDKAGYADGMNLYQYCRSRATVGLDPSGLSLIGPGDPGWNGPNDPGDPSRTKKSKPPAEGEPDKPPPAEQPPIPPVAPDPRLQPGIPFDLKPGPAEVVAPGGWPAVFGPAVPTPHADVVNFGDWEDYVYMGQWEGYKKELGLDLESMVERAAGVGDSGGQIWQDYEKGEIAAAEAWERFNSLSAEEQGTFERLAQERNSQFNLQTSLWDTEAYAKDLARWGAQSVSIAAGSIGDCLDAWRCLGNTAMYGITSALGSIPPDPNIGTGRPEIDLPILMLGTVQEGQMEQFEYWEGRAKSAVERANTIPVYSSLPEFRWGRYWSDTE